MDLLVLFRRKLGNPQSVVDVGIEVNLSATPYHPNHLLSFGISGYIALHTTSGMRGLSFGLLGFQHHQRLVKLPYRLFSCCQILVQQNLKGTFFEGVLTVRRVAENLARVI